MVERTDISVTFFTRINIRSEDFAQKFYGLLSEYNGVLIPQEFDGGRLTNEPWTLFDPANPKLAVQVWTQLGNILMRRREPIELLITLNMHFAASGRFNTASISIEECYFNSLGNIDTFLELCLALYDLLHPTYGMGHQVRDKLETNTIVDPRYGQTVIPTNLSKGIPGVYWANFLGPEYVAMLGRDRVLLAPCFQLRELSDGGVLILTSPSPLDPSSAGNRHAQLKLRHFLGEDLFYPSKAMPTRIPRFRFDAPSLEPGECLLANDAIDMVKKKAKAQNFIASVDDLASLLLDEFAEQGIENLGQDLGSLRILDQVLLRKREAGETLDEFTARMFAAYAGEIAKRLWNGQWVVDEVTGEAAIQVKGTKLFPLARVFKFWGSNEGDAFTTIFSLLNASAE